MTDIDLAGLTVDCAGKAYRIPIDPPMDSLRDARSRVVDMDRLATLYLHKSPITVKEYVLPYGPSAINLLVVSAIFIGFSQRWWFQPGGPVERALGPSLYGPKVASFAWSIQPKLFWGLLLVHSAEMLYFIRYKLAAHSVNPRTPQYWLWAVSVLVEGIGAQGRFRKLIEQKEAAKAKQKH